jgi:hypothetical protein
VENGEKLGQLHIFLFIDALQNQKFAWCSCSNHWEKHRTTFVKVVEGTSHYNFCFLRKFRPVQIFEEKRGQTGVDWGFQADRHPSALERRRTSRARPVRGRMAAPVLDAWAHLAASRDLAPRGHAYRGQHSEAPWSPCLPRAASSFAPNRPLPALPAKHVACSGQDLPLCTICSHIGSRPSRLFKEPRLPHRSSPDRP